MKKTVPLLIVIIGGVIWLAWVFVPHRIIQDVFYYDFYLPWARAMAPFAMLLGVISLSMMHYGKIKRRVPKWQYSFFFFAGFIVTSLAGFIGGTQKGGLYMWIFENMQMPMSATMFSLLAFYMASAAYKAFRARSPEATVLLVAAIIVMLLRSHLELK
jgi:cation transport ATPase